MTSKRSHKSEINRELRDMSLDDLRVAERSLSAKAAEMQSAAAAARREIKRRERAKA